MKKATSDALHNVDTSSVSEVETTLEQRCTMSFERSFKVDATLFQGYVNVLLIQNFSSSYISKPIWLVISMDLQRD